MSKILDFTTGKGLIFDHSVYVVYVCSVYVYVVFNCLLSVNVYVLLYLILLYLSLKGSLDDCIATSIETHRNRLP